MQRDVFVELIEERNAITNQDRQNRIANFVGQPQTEAFARDRTAPSKPDVTEPGTQVTIYELREIARVELDCGSGPWQLASREDESWFVPVGPPEPFGFESKRGLIGSRSHHIAVDRLEKRLDESWVHRVSACVFVRRFEPVDAPVPSRDEAVEARRHVDRYTRIRIRHVGPDVECEGQHHCSVRASHECI